MNPDAAVKAQLERELQRLRAGDAFAALGVAQSASSDEIRAAFLQATKRYHPNRFARHGRDVGRLANEVFLLIKEAYQELRGETLRSSGHVRRLSREPMESAGAPRPGKPTQPLFAANAQRPINPRAQAPMTTPPLGTPLPPRPPKPEPAPPPPVAESKKTQPGVGMPAIARPPAAEPDRAPATTGPASAAPPSTQPADVRSQRAAVTFQSPAHSLGASATAGNAGRYDEAFRQCLELCRQGRWPEARAGLYNLAHAFPDDIRLRVHLHYAYGRELQDLGKTQDAYAHYQRALYYDAQFEPARRAAQALSAAFPHK